MVTSFCIYRRGRGGGGNGVNRGSSRLTRLPESDPNARGRVRGVRVLFHNLISPISIYTRRAFWARLSMLHVIEFNLWPKSSAPQSIEK